MKIQEEYSNFEKGLLFLIGDKHPTLASNDSKKLSYFISLANFKNGFDYYELTRLSDGGVYFSIVTMLGFKTSMNHFNKEQYQALKKGYVKKESKGCMNSIAFVILFILGVISFY